MPSADPYFRRYGLLFLETDKLQDLATRLAGAQAALGMLNEDPNLRGLARMLDLVLGNVGGEAPAGLTDLLGRLADSAESVAAGTPERLSWTGLVSGGEEDRLGNRRFVLAQPSLDNASFARGRPSLSAAEQAIATLRTEPVGQGVTARITGDMALRQTELDTVAGSAGIASVLSFLLVSAVLIVGMRSGRLIGAVMGTLMAGLLLAAAVATLSVGQLNLISVTCAVMFFGLGDDFGSHLSLRYQEELRRGLPPMAGCRRGFGRRGTGADAQHPVRRHRLHVLRADGLSGAGGVRHHLRPRHVRGAGDQPDPAAGADRAAEAGSGRSRHADGGSGLRRLGRTQQPAHPDRQRHRRDRLGAGAAAGAAGRQSAEPSGHQRRKR